MPPARANVRTDETEMRLPVLLPLRLSHPYDYAASPDSDIRPGDYVRVPLGGREAIGVVWDKGSNMGNAAPKTGRVIRLKAIREILPGPPMPANLRRFVEWVAAYTMTPPGLVLRMTMPIPEALRPAPATMGLHLCPGMTTAGKRLTAKRLQVIGFLRCSWNNPLTKAALAKQAGVGAGVVQGLLEAGLLEKTPMAAARVAQPDGDKPGPKLSKSQETAAKKLTQAVADGTFQPFLLDGVTGSGKTEVYFEAIAKALHAGKQALVLLPEISLSAQWLARFDARFHARPVVWHSGLGGAKRRRNFRAIACGEARVVVGARSALFLPFPELGLLIVDEEHDASYKQEDGVIYQARDMAIVRAKLEKCPIVLASATPSLETMRNAETGRYARVHLPVRHGGADLPKVRLIDLRKDPPPRGKWLSPILRDAVADTLARGEQAMLFLNRRGYAPLTLCRKCGHRFQCPACTAWLVAHRQASRLICHHCGYCEPMPAACPACGGEATLVPCGPGVERLAEEATELFPDARIAIMTSDTASTAAAAASLVQRMQTGEIDLLIGTQIMAKGHHFANLTLVGAIDADLGLAGGDLRATERCYQMLHQVSGRAGREARPGTAYLQTHQPETPVMVALAAGARDRFLAIEAQAREEGALPPFGKLAALILSGTDAGRVERYARHLRRAAPQDSTIHVFGPAPAPLATLRGKYRFRLLVKAHAQAPLQKMLHGWLAPLGPPAGVKLQIDIDPYSFL
ncbi:MAG: primosomal protein N' [Rhodospirillaceae bacterium]|nr:MAG: primosomal protein N' [Rhodospirillaceae bacterium]